MILLHGGEMRRYLWGCMMVLQAWLTAALAAQAKASASSRSGFGPWGSTHRHAASSQYGRRHGQLPQAYNQYGPAAGAYEQLYVDGAHRGRYHDAAYDFQPIDEQVYEHPQLMQESAAEYRAAPGLHSHSRFGFYGGASAPAERRTYMDNRELRFARPGTSFVQHGGPEYVYDAGRGPNPWEPRKQQQEQLVYAPGYDAELPEQTTWDPEQPRRAMWDAESPVQTAAPVAPRAALLATEMDVVHAAVAGPKPNVAELRAVHSRVPPEHAPTTAPSRAALLEFESGTGSDHHLSSRSGGALDANRFAEEAGATFASEATQLQRAGEGMDTQSKETLVLNRTEATLKDGLKALIDVVHGVLDERPKNVSDRADNSMLELGNAPADLLSGLGEAQKALQEGDAQEDVLDRLDTIRNATRHLTKKAEVLEEQIRAYAHLYKGLDNALASLQRSVEK